MAMVFWLIIAAIALSVTGILVAAARTSTSDHELRGGAESDIAVYKDQLAEVDRDRARGVLSDTDAEQVRLEVSRRLLEADNRQRKSEPSLSGSRFVIAAVPAAILLGSGAIYYGIGAPGYIDLPIKGRLEVLDAARANRMSQTDAEEQVRATLPMPDDVSEDFLTLMAQLRAALAERPGDIQGLTLLAQHEARLGRFAESRDARERLLAALGDDAAPGDYLSLLDAMVFAAAGYVSPEAEALLLRILGFAPQSVTAQYYLGLVEAQNGRADLAFPIWRRLLEDGPQDAPWVPVIRSEIAAVAAAAGVQYRPPEVRGPSAADIAAAEELTEEERQDMIRGMVAGLADRLATEGGPATDWARLITSLGVLGEMDRATEIADEALLVFADDRSALEIIENARSRAGIGE